MASRTVPSPETLAWRAVAPRLVVIAVILAAGFSQTWSAMFRVWTHSETYSHGLVVVPVSAWLVWRERAHWLALLPQASWRGLPLVIAGSAGWLVAELAGVNVVAQYSLLLIVGGLTWVAVGSSVTRNIAFALAFLLFMVPAGESLNAPLMEATATATIAALRAVGLPVYREGMLFTLPTGSWSVVEACSGLRYILAAAMLGALFSWLNFRSWRLRIVFFVAALGLALVGNWARAWLIVVIGHLSDMRYGTGADHVWYGWVFFGAVMWGLFWMGNRWKERPSLPPLMHPSPSALDPSALDQSVLHQSAPNQSALHQSASTALRGSFGFARNPWPLAVALLITLLTSVAGDTVTASVRQIKPHSVDLQALAEMLEIDPSGETDLASGLHGARWVLQGRLRQSPKSQVVIAYFAAQQEGREMIAHGNGLPDTLQGWTRIGQTRARPSLTRSARSTGLDMQRHWYQSTVQPGRYREIGQWYLIDGTATASEWHAKWLTAWSLLRGHEDHSMVIRVDLPEVSRHELSQREQSRRSLSLEEQAKDDPMKDDPMKDDPANGDLPTGDPAKPEYAGSQPDLMDWTERLNQLQIVLMRTLP